MGEIVIFIYKLMGCIDILSEKIEMGEQNSVKLLRGCISYLDRESECKNGTANGEVIKEQAKVLEQ